jgi:hypothetical protein
MPAVFYEIRYYKGKDKYPFKAYSFIVHDSSVKGVKKKSSFIVTVLSRFFSGKRIRIDINGPLIVNDKQLQSDGSCLVKWEEATRQRSLKAVPFDYKNNLIWCADHTTLKQITLKVMENRFGINKSPRKNKYYIASNCKKINIKRTGMIDIIHASSIAEACFIFYKSRLNQIQGKYTDVSWLCDIY